MIQFSNTDEFLRIAANFMAKGIMIRHPNELLAINNSIYITQDKIYINELYKKTRVEIVKNLEGEASLNVKKEYLGQLQRMFSSDPLDKWLPLIDKARIELSSQIETTNPGTVSMTDALQAIAVFQVQSLCLMAIDDFTSFTNGQKMWLGHCYLIATNGDRLISELLREVNRQISLFDAETPAPLKLPVINQLSPEETSQSEPYDYVGIHLERARDAELHDLNITSLIRAKRYKNWWDMQEQELPRKIASGNGFQYFYYPKPYSQKYFWRFLYLIVNTSFTSVKTALYEQFFGDKLDRDYIEGLLLHAEHDCFLTKEGAVVIADDENELAFEDPTISWPFGTYPDGVENLSDSIFWGGEKFKQRAKLVRDWCQEMASKELDAQISNGTSHLDTMQVSDVKVTASQPNTLLKTRRGGNAIEPDQRESSIELEKFLSDANVKTEDVDDVAKAAGFWPPSPLAPSGRPLYNHVRVKFAPAKLSAVADALKDFIKARKRTDFVLAMSSRYGHPTTRVDNTKGGEYNIAKEGADAIVKSIKARLEKKKLTNNEGD